MGYVILVLVILILLAVFLYAYLYEPFQLVTKYETISNTVGAKIVHFTDIHYGKSFNNEQLRKVVDEINALEKDVVVFSGDLFVDDYNGEVDSLTRLLKEIDCQHKYAVWGNHDYKDFAIQHFETVLKNADFKILKDEREIININGKTVNVVGTDDYRAGTPNQPVVDHLNKDINVDYSILLVHVPDVAPQFVDDGYQLILSGHTHGGQIRPIGNIGWRTSYGRVYINDLFMLENNTQLYVSTGLGTTSLRVRFRCKPSITVLNI